MLACDFEEFLVDLEITRAGIENDKPLPVVWVKGK